MLTNILQCQQDVTAVRDYDVRMLEFRAEGNPNKSQALRKMLDGEITQALKGREPYFRHTGDLVGGR
jgi:hypothetical protein